MKGWRSNVDPAAALAAAQAAQAAAAAASAVAAAAQVGADASLKKAQNLADVTSTAVARNSIGANQIALETRFASLDAGTAEVRYMNWPFASTAGFAVRLVVTLEGVLLSGDVMVEVTIDGAPTTPAALVIPQAGSGPGEAYSMLFTASNAIAAGAVIGLSVGGENTSGVGAAVTLTAIF